LTCYVCSNLDDIPATRLQLRDRVEAAPAPTPRPAGAVIFPGSSAEMARNDPGGERACGQPTTSPPNEWHYGTTAMIFLDSAQPGKSNPACVVFHEDDLDGNPLMRLLTKLPTKPITFNLM
jgi:hypothetical protein